MIDRNFGHLVHINYGEVFDAVSRDMNEGFCINPKCGDQTLGVEPDADEHRCLVCGEFSLCGAEMVLIMLENEEKTE